MIIVFGSNVLDLFFDLANLPDRDQVKFLDSHKEEPGGKGANQAVAAALAGSNVRFYGALGEGGHGRQMYKNLAKYGIDVSGVDFLDSPSGLATIFVDETDGTHRIVVSQGANLLAKEETIPNKFLGHETVVLVQGELPIEETEKLLIRAKENGATTAMNFAPATAKLTPDLLEALDIIILNEYEADAVGIQVDIDTSDKVAFGCDLFDKYNIITLVTLGPDGAIAVDNENIYKVGTLPIGKATDTVGAGDAFSGYLCAALEQKKTFEEALKWASVAGSLACTKFGAQTALPENTDVLSEVDKISLDVTPRTNAGSKPDLKQALSLK